MNTPRLAFLQGDRGDTQRQAADSRLEDALGSLERNAFAFEDEAALQLTPIEQI
jgi:hypothetical protein